MEFNIKRVYSAVNADEVKVGSKVIVADTLFQLKDCTYRNVNVREISEIRDDDCTDRFVIGDLKNGYQYYPLCYLIEEPSEKKLKWTDLKIGDVIRNKELPFIKHLITGIDEGVGQVFFCDSWTKSDELEEWEKVE